MIQPLLATLRKSHLKIINSFYLSYVCKTQNILKFNYLFNK